MDTAAKRASAFNLAGPWRGPMVVPSGTIDDSERAAAMFLYSGFDYAGDDGGGGGTTLRTLTLTGAGV